MESKLVDRISILKVSNSDSCFQGDDRNSMLEFQEEPHFTPSDDDRELHDHQQEKPKKEEEQPKNDTDHINTPAKQERKTPSSPEQELINNNKKGVDAVEDDNDGFKTPTSLDHKIPVMKECPPAPRKSKPHGKRKVPSSSSPANDTGRRTLNLIPEQLEGLFSPTFLLSDLRAKIKKARRDHHDDDTK